MLFSNRKPRSSVARRRGATRPALNVQRLEDRQLLAGNQIDMSTVATAPFGVQLNGPGTVTNAGYSVAYSADTNGDGFDDVAISDQSASGNAQAFLVFGSSDASTGTADWGAISNNGTARVGNLGRLGTTGQLNGYNFNGIGFTIDDTQRAGATVAAVGNVGTGLSSIMVGFPNADGGAGRAYLIYGAQGLQTLAQTSPVINLDHPPTNLSVVTFRYQNPANFPNAHAGRAMASVGNVFGNGANNIAIGAPDVSAYGTLEGGAVYVVSGSVLSTAATRTVFLDTVGQSGGTSGLLLTGTVVGDTAGTSIARIGSFDGTTLDTMAIGAPSAPLGGPPQTTGNAYVIYGSTTLGNLAVTTNGITHIPLSAVGGTGTGAVTGIDFVGTGTDQTGFSVNSAGDFNGDGIGDLIIGSPSANSSAGLVTLVYGRAASSTAGRITGVIPINQIPTTIPNVRFTGPTANSFAGWSVAPVGKMISGRPNEILIGAPGFFNNAGIVYLIPGQASLFGTQSLSTATSNTLSATVITDSTPPGPAGTTAQNAFGYSVSGRLTTAGQTRTLDTDAIGDFVIGAPGISPLTGPVASSGVVFPLEGRFVPLSVPVNAAITTQIGVDQPFPPFSISATTPNSMQIFVFSNNTITPPFRPVTDIDPATVVVDGVAFPNATIAQDPVDENGDGIPDAIITISPRSSLNLPNGTQTFTISGRTLATSPNANKQWTGSTSITVSGGGSITPIGPVGPVTNPFFSLNFPELNGFVPPLGERLVPQVSTLSKLTWRPIPFRVAYQQFDPTKPYAFRQHNFFDPIHTHALGSRHRDRGSRTSTLGKRVFTRDPIHAGKTIRYEHPQAVIPPYLQVEGTVSKEAQRLR